MIPHFKGEYNFLDNFYPSEIEYKGRKFATVEHAFQSEKSNDESFKDKLSVSNSVNPSYSKYMGRSLEEIREDWDEVKFDVMKECLREKFKRDPFRTKLLETGDENIQEGNWHDDKIWGVDLKQDPNYGENHLGRLLMEVREELKNGEL